MKNKLVWVTSLLAATIGELQAAVPAAASDAITVAGTDAASIGTMVLVALAGIAAVFLMIKVISRV